MSVPRFVLASAVALALAAPLAARDRAEFSSKQPPSAEAPTLKVFSRETWVDVAVTDDRGNPVHGLTRDDFTIFEDGQPMKANSFAEHRSDWDQPTEPIAVKETLPPNTFSNVDPTPSDAPINILLFDSSNGLSLAVQGQMLDYVNRVAPGTRLAVLRLTYHLSILQGITTDRELVRTAIASEKLIPGDFGLADGDHLTKPPFERAASVSETAEWEGAPPPEDELSSMSMRAEYDVNVMKMLARYLSGMPGARTLSGLPDSPRRVLLAERSSPRSIFCRAPTSPSIPSIPAVRAMHLRVARSSLAMGDMADQTGGRFYASRDVEGPVAQILDQGSNFYALTYIPTDQAVTSGQFRNITVKVNRPGLHLTYRPGYYATDPAKSLTGMKLPPQPTAMQAAMLRGGLTPTQILFKVRLDPASSTTAALAAGSQPNPKKMKPPYRSITVSYSIDIDSIAFRRSGDGRYHADFEFGAMVYNADGDLVNTASLHVRPVLTAAAYQAMLKNGAPAYQKIDVPANGDYTLRIGVHDLTSDHVGALEVPTSAIAATH